ncbi:MAG: hypothetical protein ACLFRQ_08660 [Desulfonatronovibrio sp.]
MSKKPVNKSALVSVILFVLLFAVGLVAGIRYELFAKTVEIIHQDISSALFIILTIVLPVIGFPISIFLVLAGIKFGTIYGILLWLLILPFHALIGFFLALWVRKPLKQISSRMGYPIPPLPEKGTAMFSFLFLAIPGIPYAGKNYILSLAGAPFRYCVIMNFIVQFPQGIPFIILGESVMELDPVLFYIALALILLIYILLRWLKNRYRSKIQPASKSS